jgi:hypothetical protein
MVVAAAIGRPAQQIRTAALVDLQKAAGELDKSMPILIGMGEVFRESRNIGIPSSRRHARWPSTPSAHSDGQNFNRFRQAL